MDLLVRKRVLFIFTDDEIILQVYHKKITGTHKLPPVVEFSFILLCISSANIMICAYDMPYHMLLNQEVSPQAKLRRQSISNGHSATSDILERDIC